MLVLSKLNRTFALNKLNYEIGRLSSKFKMSPKIILRMNSHHIPDIKPTVTPKIENKVRSIDKVPKDYILVYRSPITNHMTVGYHISWIFIVTGCLGLYYSLYCQKINYPTSFDSGFLGYQSENDLLLTYGGMIAINLALLMICRAHAARIWYDSNLNKYLMFVVNGMINPSKRVEFKPGDIRQKYRSASNSITRAPHLVNGRTFHVIESNFKTPADYYKMLSND